MATFQFNDDNMRDLDNFYNTIDTDIEITAPQFYPNHGSQDSPIVIDDDIEVLTQQPSPPNEQAAPLAPTPKKPETSFISELYADRDQNGKKKLDQNGETKRLSIESITRNGNTARCKYAAYKGLSAEETKRRYDKEKMNEARRVGTMLGINGEESVTADIREGDVAGQEPTGQKMPQRKRKRKETKRESEERRRKIEEEEREREKAQLIADIEAALENND